MSKFALCSRLICKKNKRDKMVKLLLKGADIIVNLNGCRFYSVGTDVKNENAIWIFQVWDRKILFTYSLRRKAVNEIRQKARMYMNLSTTRHREIKVQGGRIKFYH